MNMKLSAPLFGLALLACGNVQAQAFVIDDFSVDQGPVLAFHPGSNPGGSLLSPPVAGLGVPNADRFLSAEVFASPTGAIINTNISGGNLNVSMSATTLNTSFVGIDYSFPSFNLATTGNTFALHVVSADQDIQVDWFLNGVLAISSTWPADSNFDVTESFSDFNPAALAAATQITLEITAPNRAPGTGFFAVFSSLQTQTVPEPATFSLMALGLAGLGWSRRRRA
jgi:hypothetical protein